MGLFDSLSKNYVRPKELFSVLMDAGDVLTFRAPTREELPGLHQRASDFARDYIAIPEVACYKISTELRLRVFVIHDLLVSCESGGESVAVPTLGEWAKLATLSFQVIDAIYNAIERQTSVTVFSADTQVVEEAKKKLGVAHSNSTDSTLPPNISEGTPTSAKESQ